VFRVPFSVFGKEKPPCGGLIDGCRGPGNPFKKNRKPKTENRKPKTENRKPKTITPPNE